MEWKNCLENNSPQRTFFFSFYFLVGSGNLGKLDWDIISLSFPTSYSSMQTWENIRIMFWGFSLYIWNNTNKTFPKLPMKELIQLLPISGNTIYLLPKIDSVLKENPELFFHKTCVNSRMQKGLGGHSCSWNQCLGGVFYLLLTCAGLAKGIGALGLNSEPNPALAPSESPCPKHSGLGLSTNYFIISVNLNINFNFHWTLKTFIYNSSPSFEQTAFSSRKRSSSVNANLPFHTDAPLPFFKDTRHISGLIHLYFLLNRVV